MSSDNPRVPARRYSDREVRQILKHATGMQEAAEVRIDEEREGMTLAEVQEAAAEVGIEPRYLERAASLVEKRPEGPGTGIAFLGVPSKTTAAKAVRGTLLDEDYERIVETITRELGQGQASMVGRTLEWRSSRRPVSVKVSSGSGETRIEAEYTLSDLVALHVALGAAGVAAFVVLALGGSPLTAVTPLGILAVLYVGARWLAKRLRPKRKRVVEELVDRLVRYVRTPTRTTSEPPE